MLKKRLIYILIFLVGCSPRVVHFTNSSANFSDYHSFFIVNFKINSKDLSAEGRDIVNKIEQEVANEMAKRGYEQSSVNPDLILRYEIISNQVTTANVNQNYYPYSYYPFSISTRTFLESALLFELTDESTKKMVWQASIDLNKYTKRNKQEEVIDYAIQQVFDTYLYRAGKKQPDLTLTEE